MSSTAHKDDRYVITARKNGTGGVYHTDSRHRAGASVFKNIREILPFVIGVLAISIIFGWLAWYHLGSVVADAPVVVKIVHP
jgi:hypothetical protein